MEIKINAKFPGRGDVNFEFSCTEQETAMLIQDPVYQDFGKVLVDHIKWESEQCRKQQDEGGHWRDMRSQNYHDRVKDVERNLSRTLDKVVKNRDITQLDVMKHTIKVLEDRIASLKKRNSDF